MNQYDIWGGFDRLLGKNAILVMIGRNDFPEALKQSFDSYKKRKFISYKNKKILREYSIFECYNFKSMPSRGVESY
ncbi:MAG: hypothetical protein HY806_01400 [Nitrospirae bacterium]|nr:hypothetical protein [Nitrospirota bacterium]MBI4837810.1 hypothetical protein [Nitrospirota bacterium]